LYAAWEVGVWKALREKVRPDMIVGASAGAWNGWAIAGGSSAEELADQWLDPLTGKIMQFGLHRNGVLRPEALHSKARELFDRF
jgi:predicted acylesterase/phospholipase RssA